MAKDTPATPSKPAARSSESPRKQPRKSPQKKKAVEQVDESQWRKSHIWAGSRINKTAALELYRLKKEHLNHLKHTTEEREIVIQGELKKVTTFMYCERDVEYEAWKLHGGPEGFEAYLGKLRATHQKKYPGKEFKAPSVYHPSFQGGAATVSIVSLPPLPPGVDPYANTPTLVDLKRRIVEKARGDQWLWDACNTHLRFDHYQFPNNTNHAKAVHAALRDLPNYPSRIPLPTELSPSFKALQDLLVEAPTKASLEGDAVDGDTKNIRLDEDPFPHEIYFYWSKDYFTEVYEALMNIIRAHGVGPEGWAAARWMVYDKYSEWEGIKINEERSLLEKSYTAQDGAFGWLQGRLPDGEKPQLEFALFDVDNHPPSIWAHYNALLPINT